MQIYRMVTALALIFGVIAFAQFVSDDAIPQRDSAADTQWESARDPSVKQMDRKAVLSKVKEANALADAEGKAKAKSKARRWTMLLYNIRVCYLGN